MTQNNRKYKLTIILDTRAYEAPVETLEEKISGILKDLGAEVESVDNLGRKEFIRVTEKEHTGDTYLQVQASGPAGLPAAFQERIRLDRNIKRAMVEAA